MGSAISNNLASSAAGLADLMVDDSRGRSTGGGLFFLAR